MSETQPFWGRVVVWLATGLGAGRAPVAPGTCGTLWGLPLSWAILQLPHLGGQLAVIVGLFLIGIPLCSYAAHWLGQKDPGAVVWDEIVTVPIVFLGTPPDAMHQPLILVLGFALHRLFDISKLPPARQLERLRGGLGIMADDVAAAVYGCAVMALWRWVTQ